MIESVLTLGDRIGVFCGVKPKLFPPFLGVIFGIFSLVSFSLLSFSDVNDESSLNSSSSSLFSRFGGAIMAVEICRSDTQEALLVLHNFSRIGRWIRVFRRFLRSSGSSLGVRHSDRRFKPIWGRDPRPRNISRFGGGVALIRLDVTWFHTSPNILFPISDLKKKSYTIRLMNCFFFFLEWPYESFLMTHFVWQINLFLEQSCS